MIMEQILGKETSYQDLQEQLRLEKKTFAIKYMLYANAANIATELRLSKSLNICQSVIFKGKGIVKYLLDIN